MERFRRSKRFWSKVDISDPDECWKWLACTGSDGYGRFTIHGRIWNAHRVAWTLTYGPIPDGLCICHHCDNRICCNPCHLFLGTHKDNAIDSASKGRRAWKITKEGVRALRDLHATGRWTYQELADEFGVDASYAHQIVNRQRWKWLDNEEVYP